MTVRVLRFLLCSGSHQANRIVALQANSREMCYQKLIIQDLTPKTPQLEEFGTGLLKEEWDIRLRAKKSLFLEEKVVLLYAQLGPSEKS